MGGGDYDASRLLLLDVARKFGVDGDYIAMVPNRDTLLVTDSNEDAGLAIMAAQAEKALESHHPLCAIPMRLVGDEWETWMPERDDPLYQQFRLLAIKSMGSEHGEQKELLEQLHEQTGNDGDGDIVAQLEWDQVQAAFGEPLDMYPPRYRVS